MTRSLLFLVNEENRYEFNEILKRYIKITVFDEDERNILNLCFKTIFVEIKKVLVISK